MTRFLLVALTSIFLSACTTRTQFGECVGFNGTKDPTLVYNIDAMNVAMSVVFFETVFVPVIVFLSYLECPVGKVK